MAKAAPSKMPSVEQEAPAASLRPVELRRAFEEVLRHLELAFADGELAPGDRLPPERELAAHFQVSRTSVREAIRVLETFGVLEVRRGAEHGAVLMREPGNAFATTLRLLVGLRHVGLEDIIGFRVMAESAAAQTLAERPDPAAFAQLEALLALMEDPSTSQHDFHALDATFHVTLVHAAGNRLVNLLESAVDDAFRKIITDVARVAWDWQTVRPQLIGEHRAIHAAIVGGDSAQAQQLVTRHVRLWGGRVSGSA